MLVTCVDDEGNIFSYEMNDYQSLGELKENIAKEVFIGLISKIRQKEIKALSN